MRPGQLLLLLSILDFFVYNATSTCFKRPEGVTGPRNRNVGEKYIIEIPGNPKTYTPFQTYNVFLKVGPRSYPQKAFKHFMISLEADGGEDGENLGQLSVENDIQMLARFSTKCPNTVVESNTALKTEIQVIWKAPPPGSGCVNIIGTVVESSEDWYRGDGKLTKRLCEESLENENIQPDIIKKCCACNEAKYEMAFEGKWTRNTHPRNFPSNVWMTKFSDVIGASHQLDHAFWKYDDMASEGLIELALHGTTKTLESELKDDSEHIRTIIKARGLQYPNITKTTYAVFRVDRNNHLVSLVTKIIPSPDWIVGVSNLELCQEDCTWAESRTLNLYPWDVGMDDGLGYESSAPVREQQSIRKITPNSPNHPSSPFYSDEGEEMKPIAKLYLTRQSLYPKTCEPEETVDEDCSEQGEWTNWTPCSVTCGEGVKFRQRTNVDKDKAFKCGFSLLESSKCFTYCSDELEASIEDTKPTKEHNTENENTMTCGDEPCEEDPNCPGTFWGPWSNCSSTNCVKGTRTRIRMRKQQSDDEDNNCKPTEEEECTGPCNEGEFGDLGVPRNIVSQGPVGKVVDCKVSKWSSWSSCILNDDAICGEGYRVKARKIVVHQANGGKECPKLLQKVKKCTKPCNKDEAENIDHCVMSGWSNWTPCSSNCGGSAVQIRTRHIIYKPEGVECPPREEKKHCRLPLACSEDGQPIYNR